MNEVIGELQKTYAFKRGEAGFGPSLPNCAFEAQGGGLTSCGEGLAIGEAVKKFGSAGKAAEFKHFGQSGSDVLELKQWGASYAQKGELKHFGSPDVCDELGNFGGGFGKHAELDQGMAAGAMGKKLAELKGGYGESYAHKALEKNDGSSWDKITNGVMFGIGAALGPVGFPIMMTAEARMMRDSLNGQKGCYGEVGSSSIQKDLIQRHKMLKSWRSYDE